MKVTVLGCHGGESRKHRTTSFLLNGRLAIDAGALTSALDLADQRRIRSVLVSHPHLDHVRDLATVADNRCQQGGPPLEIVGIADTIRTLKTHFFNGRLWPDFTKIPTTAGDPTVTFRVIKPEVAVEVAGLRVVAVRVNHTIDTVGFFVDDARSCLAYTGDTGPTDRFWQMVNERPDVSAVLAEVSFPNELADLAHASKHLTPDTLRTELAKLDPSRRGLPVYAYHIKPVFERKTLRELGKLRGCDLDVLSLDQELVLR